MHAAPGDLDNTFGIGGKVTYRFNDREDTFQAVAVQADGKIVVAGKNGGGQTIVIRYNNNGSFDSSFSGDGIFNENVGGFAFPQGIAIQSDGKIVVAGVVAGGNKDYAVIRLNPNGSVDTGFGNNGIAVTALTTGDDMIRDVQIQPDGKIVVTGSVNDLLFSGGDIGVVRYNPNGSLDVSFDGDGKVITQIENNAEQGYALALQNDGKIVVLANSINANSDTNVFYLALLRYLPDGSPDPSFDNDGLALFNLNGESFEFGDVAIQSDGKVVITASIGSNSTFLFKFTVARYLSDGSPDTNFGTNGKTVVVNNSVSAQALAIQPNGKIVAAGHTNVPGNGLDILVARLDQSGSIDNTFGTGGKVFTQVGQSPRSDYAFDLALQPDGKIVVAGDFNMGTLFDYDAVLLRFLGDPISEPKSLFDFDGDGKTDISIFRPSSGEWWYQRSSDGENYTAQFGVSTDELTPADYTGDGKTDIAVFRPGTGEWFVLRSEDASFYSFPFGTTGDIPFAGDFDADNKADSGVFRPSSATWFIRKSSDGTAIIQQFGQNEDVPVVADYDGDNKADIAIYRVSLGEWWIQRSTAGLIAFQFGNSTDKPVQGDYTGDGKADVALLRPSTGEWFVLRSENQSYYSFPFGTNGDIPAPGDYDGDGKFDATVFRPSTNTWYSQRTSAGTLIQSFGQTGDVPLPNAFVP